MNAVFKKLFNKSLLIIKAFLLMSPSNACFLCMHTEKAAALLALGHLDVGRVLFTPPPSQCSNIRAEEVPPKPCMLWLHGLTYFFATVSYKGEIINFL